MKLSNITHILAVVEAGSLRGGSRYLGISQPSMSRSIRDIENELGVPLFIRHGYGVTLTSMGEIFVRRATMIQSEIRRISEEIEQTRDNFVGEVSVAMSSAASLALMPTMLKEFDADYPQALLKLKESLFQPIEAQIHSGEIDFFVGPIHEGVIKTSLVSEKLFDNERIVVARKGHPLTGVKTLGELRGARWIRPSFANSRDEADFDAMFERAGLSTPDIAVQLRSSMMILMAVANTDLLTIVPIQWLDFAAEYRQIEVVPISDIMPAAPVCIVHRADLPLTPLAEKVSDITRKAGLNHGLRLAERKKTLSKS